MSHPVSAVVKSEGASLALRFDACRVLLGGEFAGNIELDIACDAGDVDTVADYLRVQVSGGPPSDPAIGNGEYLAGVELVFWTEASTQLLELPEEIALGRDTDRTDRSGAEGLDSDRTGTHVHGSLRDIDDSLGRDLESRPARRQL